MERATSQAPNPLQEACPSEKGGSCCAKSAVLSSLFCDHVSIFHGPNHAKLQQCQWLNQQENPNFLARGPGQGAPEVGECGGNQEKVRKGSQPKVRQNLSSEPNQVGGLLKQNNQHSPEYFNRTQSLTNEYTECPGYNTKLLSLPRTRKI